MLHLNKKIRRKRSCYALAESVRVTVKFTIIVKFKSAVTVTVTMTVYLS